MTQNLSVYFEPKLIEETVFRAQTRTPLAREFDAERQRIYEIADIEAREQSFQELHARWFHQLALGHVITQAINEQPLITEQLTACYVVWAVHAKQEGAELYVNRDERRTLRITLRPESLLNAMVLQPFLRNELFHIADMLDPAYGYEPVLPKSTDGPTYDNFITHRYRVLWNVTISARMMRRGWLPATARKQALNEFVTAFPMLRDDEEQFFDKFFRDDQPRHGELAAFAFEPLATSDDPRCQSAQATHCPLCQFPTHAFEPAAQDLAADVRAAITADFPAWTPEAGLCIQCADLYRGRRLSLAALQTLPGWNSAA